MESFSISFMEELFKKVEVAEIRYQYLTFPYEVKQAIIRFKSEEDILGDNSASDYESEERYGSPSK